MRICIDIDGTICELRQPHQSYKDLKPIANAAEKIKQLKYQGHYIILYTARHMKTCEANIGKIIALQAHTLIEWLKKHDFEYDELLFGKPYADRYIDDKGIQFKGSWQDTYNELIDSSDKESL